MTLARAATPRTGSPPTLRPVRRADTPDPSPARPEEGIARAVADGAERVVDDSGREAVAFPAPPWATPAQRAPSTPAAPRPPGGAPLARAVDVPRIGADIAPHTRETEESPPAPSIDEIYDTVVDRLRRELMVERERLGDSLGDLPR